MYIIISAMIFFVGTIFMSFLGMLVYRMPIIMKWRETTKPCPDNFFSRSSCESCGRVIPLLFIIPLIGYFFCRGKCFYCKEKIPLIYPLMELLGGITFLGFFLWGGVNCIDSAIIIVMLIFIAWMDVNETWIPLIVTIPLFWIGLCWSHYQPDAEARILGGMLGFTVSYLSMRLTSYLTKNDVVAGGDIALITCAGAWLGVDIMPELLILISFIFIIYATPYRLKNITFVPMGPAICLGFIICIMQLLIC